jgi:L-ascorbate metabolism protein UlaG (beta-lactamase superfamily)
MKFTWIGGASFVLELGPFRIVGDPVLRDDLELEGTGRVARLSPVTGVATAGADVVLVTSLRADHADADAVAGCGAATILVPRGGESFAPGARAVAPGDSVPIEKDGTALAIAAVPAGTGNQDVGYFLTLGAGERPFTAYVTGDTLFSEDTRAIQRTHGHANLLVVNVGAERAPDGSLRSADAKEAMQIVYRMQPNAVAAIHHSTFSHYTEPIDPLLEKIGLTIYEKRLRVLRAGESFQKTTGPAE